MRRSTLALIVAPFAIAPFPLAASEADALAIDAAIMARHMPFGTILNPIYASSTSTTIIGYTRCGDSALWITTICGILRPPGAAYRIPG